MVNSRILCSVFFLLLFIPSLLPASDRTGFVESSDSVKIYFETTGAGEPLVLIAGGPGDSHTYFKPYFDKLANKFTVVYYDARGRGRSGKTTADKYSVDKDVEDLENLRRYLGYEKLNLFGHSYGGVVAESYALAYPEHVVRLILCNTFHGAAGWQNNIDNCNRHIQQSYPEVWTKLMDLRQHMASNKTEWRAVYDPCIENLYWFNVSKKKKYREDYRKLRQAEDTFSETVYYAIIGTDPDFEVNGSMKDLDLRKRLTTLHIPTLILSGRGDKIATVQQAMEIQEAIPQSKIYIFEKSGHLPFVEQNKKFIETVTKFLK